MYNIKNQIIIYRKKHYEITKIVWEQKDEDHKRK